MERKRLVSIAVFALTLAACQDKASPPGAAPSAPPALSAASSLALRTVEAREVCMVNDHHFGTDQIPVVVGGKTYFGCCPTCKGKLETDPTARTGTDPVSGKPVDKATAVIGRLSSGKVLYFESEGNLREHAARL